MTATIGLVLDCADPARLATFWSDALGYTTAGEAGNYVLLVPNDTGPPKLLLQAVVEVKATKNRMHLDIETPDVDAGVIRLESLGAHRLETDARSEHGSRWVIMANPEGNESASATRVTVDGGGEALAAAGGRGVVRATWRRGPRPTHGTGDLYPSVCLIRH